MKGSLTSQPPFSCLQKLSVQVTKFIAFITLLQVYRTEASLLTPAKSTYYQSFFSFLIFQSYYFFIFFYLLKVYFPIIRSVLEYCFPMRHNALPVKLSDSIERVQKRTLRYLSSAALPTGLSYYRVCITSHKKNGVV